MRRLLFFVTLVAVFALPVASALAADWPGGF